MATPPPTLHKGQLAGVGWGQGEGVITTTISKCKGYALNPKGEGVITTTISSKALKSIFWGFY